MTQISKEQLEALKHAVAEGQFCDVDILPYEALSALIAIGEQIAAGTHALVPIEPTEAMVEAWEIAKPENDEHLSDEETNRAWATADWKAMIAAAQGKGE